MRLADKILHQLFLDDIYPANAVTFPLMGLLHLQSTRTLILIHHSRQYPFS